MSEMQNACWWQCSLPARVAELPRGFITLGAAVTDPQLPIEVMMLLPSGGGSRELLETLSERRESLHEIGVGLYLGDPFLNIALVVKRLRSLRVRWISNLPSLAQHEAAFRRDLQVVGFSVSNELETLSQYRQRGFRTLAVASDHEHLSVLADHPADAVVMVQTSRDLQVSFPSLTQRRSLVRRIQRALPPNMTDAPVLHMATREELDRQEMLGVARPVGFSMSTGFSTINH